MSDDDAKLVRRTLEESPLGKYIIVDPPYQWHGRVEGVGQVVDQGGQETGEVVRLPPDERRHDPVADAARPLFNTFSAGLEQLSQELGAAQAFFDRETYRKAMEEAEAASVDERLGGSDYRAPVAYTEGKHGGRPSARRKEIERKRRRKLLTRKQRRHARMHGKKRGH